MDTQTINEQLLSGETWSQFCDHLKRCGQQILRPETPADPATRAEGYRYLTRLLRIALEMHVEFADPAFPSFFKTSHETAKIGIPHSWQSRHGFVPELLHAKRRL